MRSQPLLFIASFLLGPAFANLFADLAERDGDFMDVSFGMSSYNFSDVNPRSPELAARQRGYCTRPGGIQCANMPTKCCPPGDICQVATQVCCPSYANQCGGRGCCEPSAVCCPTVITGCCVPGGTCCGATCCGPGVRCSGGVCQDFTLPTTSRTIPTTTTSSLPDACPVNGVKRAVCSGTPVETRVPGVKSLVFDYNKLSKKPKPKYNQAQKDAREKALKELFTSMCLGLEQRGKVNDDIFTFEGDQKKKDANRKAAGCHGSPCSSFPGESCDEFPFASTTDGGANAIWNCIPEMAQDIQGGVISGWKSRTKISSGVHYKFEIKGWDCKNPPKRRDMSSLEARATLDTPTTEVQDTWAPFDDDDTSNHAIIHLGDLTAGKYNVQAKANGSITRAYVVDNEGEEFLGLDITQAIDNQNFEFTLDYDKIGVSLILDTQDLEIDYTSTLKNVTTGNAAVALGPSWRQLVGAVVVVAALRL